MDKTHLSTDQLVSQATDLFRRYRAVLFIVLIALIYAFLLLRIHALDNVPAGSSSSAAPSAKPAPHVDKTVVSQLKQLQDNSVNVQALFNDARQNPFQE